MLHVDVTQVSDFVYCEAGFPLSSIPHSDGPPEATGRATHNRLRRLIQLLLTQRGDMGTGPALIVEQDPHLVSSTLGLSGKPDLIIRRDDAVTIIDFKTKNSPPATEGVFGALAWDSHAAQMVAYGLLARERFGVDPTLYIVYSARKIQRVLHGLVNRFPADRPGATLLRMAEMSGTVVPFDASNCDRLMTIIGQIRVIEGRGGGFHRNHKSLNKCFMCAHRTVCAEKIVGIPSTKYPSGEPNPGLFEGETAHYPKPRWK